MLPPQSVHEPPPYDVHAELGRLLAERHGKWPTSPTTENILRWLVREHEALRVELDELKKRTGGGV